MAHIQKSVFAHKRSTTGAKPALETSGPVGPPARLGLFPLAVKLRRSAKKQKSQTATKVLRCCVSLKLNRCRRWSDMEAGREGLGGRGCGGGICDGFELWWLSRYWMERFPHALYCGSSRCSLWCVLCYIRLSCFMQMQTCWCVWSWSAEATRKRFVWQSHQDVRRGCRAPAACLIVAFTVACLWFSMQALPACRKVSSILLISWFSATGATFCTVPTCSHMSHVKN